MDVGILGCGKIGRALAQDLSTNPRVGRIVATTRAPRPNFADLPGVIPAEDNGELASVSDIVVFCVKPRQMETVVREVAEDLRDGTLLVSIAAGIRTTAIRDWTCRRFAVVRAMPNMPCRIGAGMTALAAGEAATDEHIAVVRNLFSGLGRSVAVEEV